MMKKSPETLLAILNEIARGNTHYSDVAKSQGVHPNSFWNCALGLGPDLVVEFAGLQPFEQAVHAARRIALYDKQGWREMGQRYEEPIYFSQMSSWKWDPATVGMSPDKR